MGFGPLCDKFSWLFMNSMCLQVTRVSLFYCVYKFSQAYIFFFASIHKKCFRSSFSLHRLSLRNAIVGRISGEWSTEWVTSLANGNAIND